METRSLPVGRGAIVGVVVGLLILAAGAIGLATRWSRGEVERRAIDSSTIVLLGDSITEGGDWSTLLPDHPIANQGYAGFTTPELRPVAEDVARRSPAAVLILAGTNDIRDGHPPSWTVTELGAILDLFEDRAPGTTVVIQTVLPRSDAPAAVEALNEALAELAAARDVALLDLHPSFDDGTGALRPSDTTDGLHLTERGYRRWAGQLSDALANLI